MEYDAIASAYDRFNGGFDYSDYLNRIEPWLKGMPEKRLALDCGCGTGSLMLELCARGYDCSGIDASEEMLNQAFEKLSAAGAVPHLMCQELTEIDLYGAYHAVFSSMDTLNHILDKRDLKRFFRRLHCFVEPDGYFVFDLKSKAMFSDTEAQICEENGAVLLMQKGFDGTYGQYRLTWFDLEGETYRRFDTEITERYYDSDEVLRLLRDCGFRPVHRFRYRGRTVVIVRWKELETTS